MTTPTAVGPAGDPRLSACELRAADRPEERRGSSRRPAPFATGMPSSPEERSGPHRIVIVGGGAGGLQLAARLGRTLCRQGLAEVLLIDRTLTHVWKPLLHELAAGTLGGPENELEFLQQARRHGFRFHLGRMEGLDRAAKKVWLSPWVDERGNEVAPRRGIPYDTLVLALGSVVNDFGTAGVADHAVALDTADDARRFHRLLLAACARAEWTGSGPVRLAIVGGGATGVELASELMDAVAEMAGYGTRLHRLERPVTLRLIESGPRLLAALPETLSRQALAEMEKLGVEVVLNQRVVEVGPDHLTLSSGDRLRSDITVWAAGIQGPKILANLDGLLANRAHQLVVRPTLQTTLDESIFAMGDCASCEPAPGAPPVPPRAQAAQQQARFLAHALRLRVRNDSPPLPSFVFHDRGSLVSLGRRNAIGKLLDGAGRTGGLTLRGLAARLGYWGLHRQHMARLQGVWLTLLASVGRWLKGRSQPRVKLH